ncbi:MAG: SDR family oxidoreductase [Woeseiaceae bacterium]|nr:SDR family oxidoreductase [Woeseiaceae bacterium]
MELQQKTIAVTGAGRGLGEAMALRLANQGCKLALIDLDESAVAETAGRCAESGADVETYEANVVSESDVERLFSDIAGRFGALHGLVNNAGITRDALTLKYNKKGQLVDKMSLAQWQVVMDVNLTGVFLCGREAAAKMIELECPGCIINISSISRNGNFGQLNYSASKAGVEAMAVVWAKEFARYGVRAASIAPGFIGTDMVNAMKPEARKKMTSKIPLARVGEPDEIASTVQFILENDYVNGRCFEIDGGLRL